MKKLVIGDISGQDCSGVLFDFMAKWGRSIKPVHLAAFNQGKNAWDGSFTDNPPKNIDGLINELKEQLLSGSKSIFQLKLFLVKKDYTNPILCRLQEIYSFYQEVFGFSVKAPASVVKKLDSDKFMIFSSYLGGFSQHDFTGFWKKYRFGDIYTERDNGLSRCEPLNYRYGTRPDKFIGRDIRSENRDYLLSYDEHFEKDKDFKILNSSFPFSEASQEMESHRGLTLREVFIILMFEWWKKHHYFQPKEKERYQVIPCYGSICKDSNHEKTYFPVPMVFVDRDDIRSVWASTNGVMPDSDSIRVFKSKESFTI